MSLDTLTSAVVSLRPFLPARDFRESKRFYEALGFEITSLGDKMAHVQLGGSKTGASFLLQDFYEKAFAENLMMHLLVTDLDGWWSHVSAQNLAAAFQVEAPRPPRQESWGLRVAYVWDPAGVLWHIASET